MNNIPKAVEATFEELKGKSDARMSLKVINDKYYVYRESSKYSKQLHRSVAMSIYLGRILDGGKFARKRDAQIDKMEEIEKGIRALGGEIVWQEKPGSVPDRMVQLIGSAQSRATFRDPDVVKHEIKLNDTDKKILTCLSMNCRISFAEMSKITGINQQTLYSRAKRLEKDLQIGYTCGVNALNFGYMAFVAFVKFSDRLPDMLTLSRAFANEPRIMFAGILKGEYDILALILVENTREADEIVSKLRMDPGLRNYKSIWNLSPFLRYYGSVEHPDSFFSGVVVSKVWKKTKERPRPKEGEFLNRQYVMLREIERNGRIDFTEIDEKYGLPRGTIRYTYSELHEKGVLGRPSIDIKNNNIKYTAVLLLEYTNIADFNRTKHKLVYSITKEDEVINKYSIIGEIGSPNGMIAFMSVWDDRDFYNEIKYIHDNVEGIKLTTYIMTSLFMGKIYQKRADMGYLWTERNTFLTDTTPRPKDRIDYGYHFAET